MKKTVFIICLLLLAATQWATAQNEVCSLWGVVTNEDGEVLSGVTVVVQTDSLQYGGRADGKGRYEVRFAKADSAKVFFTCVGYEPKQIKLSINKFKIQLNSTLIPALHHLQGVTVDGNPYLRKLDKMVYMPNKRQVNAANSGVGLLANLMIPNLDVNRISGSVEARDKRSVTMSIDGRETTVEEVNQLRPRDVLRVEYHDHPTGIFAGKQLVVDFITKKYDYGGFVDIRANNTFINPDGSYSARVSLDKKAINYSVLAGTSYSRNKDSHSETESVFGLNPPFTRHETSKEDPFTSAQHYGVFRAQHLSNKMYALASAGFVWSQIPDNYTQLWQNYSPAVSPVTQAKSKTYQKWLKPYVSLHSQWMLPEKQYLIVRGEYSFSNNTYRRNYTVLDGGPTYLSDVTERNTSASGGVSYARYFATGTNFKIQLFEAYGHSNGDYRGTSPSRQTLTNSTTSLFASYSLNIKQKLITSVDASGNVIYYNVNDKKKTQFFIDPSASVSWQINKHHRLSAELSLNSSYPLMNLYNNATQRVDQYLVVRGNPDLAIMHYWIGNASYGVTVKNWVANIGTRYFSTRSMAKQVYFPEEGLMVSTNVTDGNYHSFTHYFNNTLYLLNRNLQIELGCEYAQYRITGAYYGMSEQHFNWSANAMFMTGNFSVSAYYKSKMAVLFTSPERRTYRPNYGLSLTYGYKGFYVEGGVKNIFSKNNYILNALETPHYSYTSRSWSATINQQVFLRLSYTFDFGRKLTNFNLNVDAKENNGILKM